MLNALCLCRVQRFGAEALKQGGCFPSICVNGHALRGGLWSAEAKLPPTLKLRCSTPETCTASAPAGRAGELWSAEAKLPTDAEADASALQIGSRAAPLAHRIGEGLGGKKSVFRWRGWCGVFLGAFLSSKLGGVLGVVWGARWRQVQLFSVAKCCAKVGRHLI